MLSNEEICNFVRAAFLPRRCVAEIWDYECKLRFRVFDEQGKPAISMEKIILNSIRHETELQALCNQVQSKINILHNVK